MRVKLSVYGLNKYKMKQSSFSNYLFNCFWLIIPPLFISFCLLKYLPEAFQTKTFWSNIPLPVKTLENIFRIIVIALPVFFPLIIKNKRQRVGLAVYFTGVVLYLFSYLALIYFPESYWGTSVIGFSAPATTPLIWFTGIGLVMGKPFFNIKYNKWIYIILVIVFCVFHFIHTIIIYHRYY